MKMKNASTKLLAFFILLNHSYILHSAFCILHSQFTVTQL